MSTMARTLLVPLAAALGLAPASVDLGGALASGRVPLTAIYRTHATPQYDSDAPTWLYTRSGVASFAGTGSTQGRIGKSHSSLLRAISQACSPGGALRASRATADAFERTFTLHVPKRPVAGGITEVWWSEQLELPLVIVRDEGGRTLIDELVHLEFEERSDLLVREVR